MVVSYCWTRFPEILAVLRWFVVVFSGNRNRGIWDVQWAWRQSSSRVVGDRFLLFDGYPAERLRDADDRHLPEVGQRRAGHRAVVPAAVAVVADDGHADRAAGGHAGRPAAASAVAALTGLTPT